MQTAPHRRSDASPAHFKWGDETDPEVGTCHCLCFMRASFGRRRRFTVCDATSVDHHFKYPRLLWSCSNARTSIGRHSRKRLPSNEQNRCPSTISKPHRNREISTAGRDSRRQCQTLAGGSSEANVAVSETNFSNEMDETLWNGAKARVEATSLPGCPDGAAPSVLGRIMHPSIRTGKCGLVEPSTDVEDLSCRKMFMNQYFP